MSSELTEAPGRATYGAVAVRLALAVAVSAPASTAASVARPLLAAAHLLPPAAIDVLVEQQPAGVLVADRDGQLVYRNEVARRLGADVAESLRWTLSRAILTEEGVREDAIELDCADGRRRRFDLRATPVRDDAGAVAGAVLTLADVTAARRMAEWEPVIESLLNL